MPKRLILLGLFLSVAALVALFFIIRSPDTTNLEPSTESAPILQAPEPIKPKEKVLASYSLQEVASHSTKNDCWTIIDDNVYDISKFIADHPGGEVIAIICGKDGTVEFKNQGATQEQADLFRQQVGFPADSEFHSPDARNILESYEIGSVELINEQP